MDSACYCSILFEDRRTGAEFEETEMRPSCFADHQRNEAWMSERGAFPAKVYFERASRAWGYAWPACQRRKAREKVRKGIAYME